MTIMQKIFIFLMIKMHLLHLVFQAILKYSKTEDMSFYQNIILEKNIQNLLCLRQVYIKIKIIIAQILNLMLTFSIFKNVSTKVVKIKNNNV